MFDSTENASFKKNRNHLTDSMSLLACALFVSAVNALCAPSALAQVVDPPPATQPADPNNPNADSFYGKEPTEGVYVRDSATAVEKQALAQKMERLKEWTKSADLYQEVISKYADRVVPSQLDKDKKIYQYTSTANHVQERLAHWPPEGLEVYRARFETPAQTLLDNAKADDVATLNKVYALYFVTEAGKQAGIRLIDLYLENGEYPAAAWLGDRLLTLHPGLQVERSAVLYRTALAYHYAGDAQRANEHLDQLKTQFASDRGIVRGKDVILADSLAREIQAPVASSQSASADSWPMPFGDPSRSRISTAEGRPGARLYGIALSKPAWTTNTKDQKEVMQKQYDDWVGGGNTLGIMPVTDRGELFFQDGQRIYGISLESGVPLPGWSQSYPSGVYTLPGVWGTARTHQLSLTLTEHDVLAIMGHPDQQSAAQIGTQAVGEPRLVCLDRKSGREKWIVAFSQLPESARDARTLQMTGSPMVVGDSVLVVAHGVKTQFEDCYVLAFDLATGKLHWSTYIASASAGVMVWNGMSAVGQQGDDAAHLAYANGRVYVQSNLGALAALDAYTGSVVWLDIYPTGRQVNERQAFNPFMQNNQAQTPEHKPWTYNPVIISNGYVFTLPTQGNHLLIYDAATGVEIKRIDLSRIERGVASEGSSGTPFDTLVGVIDDLMVLASEKTLVCINWKNYSDEAFNPDHDTITVWPQTLPAALRGRPFMTRDAIFAPAADRLYRISLKLGKNIGEYPMHHPPTNDQTWEEPEEPGNVLATNDYVVLAGANWVNVYTDLTMARRKLDKELADAPTDPQPRLRYAEIMYAAGDLDASMSKLSEAIDLLGGVKALQVGTNRDRLFNDSLTFAEKLAKPGHNDDSDRIVKLFDLAGAAASSPVQQVHYRLSRAKFVESNNDYTAAVQFYQEILADPQLRPVPMTNDASLAPLQADGIAEKAVGDIIKDHPAAYESFQQAAAAAMEQALASKDDPAVKLLDVARTYPNSTVAGKAMIAAADSFETAGASRQAIRVLRDLWFKYPGSPDKVRIQESIARNCLVMAATPRDSADDCGPMDNMEAAAAALARAASQPGDPALGKSLKLRDGTVIDAGTPIARALETIRKYRGQEVFKALPDFRIPIPVRNVAGGGHHPWPKPFLPADDKRDVLANIKALVVPVRDFARADRVVVFTSDGVLDILPAGEMKTLSSSQAISEEPKACAWVGNNLLVWSGSQLVDFKADNGQAAWKIDLRDMAQVEVVRIGDNAETIPVAAANPDNVLVVNGGRHVIIRNGQRVVFGRPGVRPVINLPVQPVAIVDRPISGGPEEIIEVRPVGDHVLITTSAGRILSAELTTGHVGWQTRLSDRPVDRLVANDDFTVVLVKDENAARIAAFDTATGQMRCTRSWAVQSGLVPINLALAADGTLVYTMPDRLCLKDLYKPWPDPSDKEMQANQGLQLFQNATQPNQLVIAEGRILALADDGSVKYVRVHSLETGQPVPLRYHSAQGEQEVDRILNAGKSALVSLRVVGSHLYVVNPFGVISYNLDRPAETWDKTWDSATGPDSYPNIQDAFVGQKYLVLLSEPTPTEVGGPPVPIPAPGIVPAPAPPATQPGRGDAPPDANGPAVLISKFSLQIIGRYPVSDKNPAESGRLDYSETVSDPAGILPQWQACDTGFYYLTGDSRLHLLRGKRTDAEK